MKHLAGFSCGLTLAAALVGGAIADTSALVRVGLLDASAVVPAPFAASSGGNQQSGGFGMMSPGMMDGRGNYGFGMMGGGMMGPGMMAVRADQNTVKAGTVTFDVTNWSRSVIHEMLVVAVDRTDAPLPYDYSTQRVVEDQVKSLGETGELQPNQSKSISLDLAPGNYLLFCNVAGHYAAGMAVPLTVTP